MFQLLNYCFDLILESLVEEQQYTFEEQYAAHTIQKAYRKHLIRRYFRLRSHYEQFGWEIELLKP